MTESSRIEYKQTAVLKKPLPNPPLIREGSKKDAASSCSSPDKGRLGGVSSVFEIRESYLRVIFPYREGFTADTESSEKILILMQNDSTISIKALAETLQMTTRGIEKQIAELKKQGLLMRIGGAKGGYWEVLSHGK